MRSKAGSGRQFSSYKGRRRCSWSVVSAGVLAVLGLVFLVLPGVRFSGCLFLGLSAACLLWTLLDLYGEYSGIAKACKGVFLVGLAVGLLTFAALEAQVLLGSRGDDPDKPVAAVVVVLGAGVNGETPSLALQTRIDAAARYLEAHPEVPAVLSGGQGSGEAITEAEAMRRGLVARGIAEERLLLEERSTSTYENFLFSGELLAEEGLDPAAPLAVVTNDFHLFRAKLIAQRVGLTETIGIPAELPWWWLDANYTVREAFALVKTLLFDKGVTE